MSRMKHLLEPKTIEKIISLNGYIEINNLRQLNLLDAKALSTKMNDYNLPTFSESDIYNLWCLGFINADAIYSKTSINLPDIEYIGNNYYDSKVYIDRRKPVVLEKYLSAFQNIPKYNESMKLYFHPYRCFVLYELAIKFFNSAAVPSYLMQNAEGYAQVIQWHLERFEKSMQNSISKDILSYFNTLVSLSTIIEPITHRIVYENISINYPHSFEQITLELEKLRNQTSELLQEIGEDRLVYYKNEFCQTAASLDSNNNLHLLIRLMRNNIRSHLKGQIAAAMQFKEASEGFRRIMEFMYEKEFPEEDACGYTTVNQQHKIKIYGHTRILDGNKKISNLFIRNLGLDFGIKINVYVEGETEFGAVKFVFNNENRVAVINLRGSFVEAKGKGLAFRGSLRKDIDMQIYSFVVLDADKEDNLRVVKKAAENEDFFGEFLISNPDFEYGNLSTNELCQIVSTNDITKETLLEKTTECNSADDFFKVLYQLNSDFRSTYKKGEAWGATLAKYLLECYGDNDEKPFVHLVKTIYRTLNSNSYKYDFESLKTDSITGRLTNKSK